MRRAICVMMLVFLGGCTYQIPRKYLPYPVSNDTFDDPTKTVAIPLPVIASSPNEGITSGGLVAFLLHNASDEVSTLVVPQINFNQYFGVTNTLYGAFYPTRERRIKVNLSQATTINKEYRLRYHDERFLGERYELYLNAFDFADGSARFFGFQSKSSKENETNYTNKEAGFSVAFGGRVTDEFELLFGERYKHVEIDRGAVTKLPFITDVFPPESIPGVNGYDMHGQKLSLVYKTLDSTDMPTEGIYLRFSVENSLKALGSSADFRTYEFESKRYYPFREARFISVVRFSFLQTEGHDIPFLEQAILGGETTLRGYGQNRFVDKSYMLLNLEERVRLFRWEIFHVKADWELAPFVDLGTVMHSLVEATSKSFQFNPGIGLRTVVRPNIVGRIDVGFGKDGPAVFVGLGYPF